MAGIQRYAAVCGNGHVATDTLKRAVEPGSDVWVPRLCKECSAPVYTECPSDGCSAPIYGYRQVEGFFSIGRDKEVDWFCHKCDVPYIWAKPNQVREWAMNQIRFNDILTDDQADELLGLVAVLTDPEQTRQRENYRSFKERVATLGQVAEDLEPLVRLFRLITLDG